jgi:hypothetical protein
VQSGILAETHSQKKHQKFALLRHFAIVLFHCFVSSIEEIMAAEMQPVPGLPASFQVVSHITPHAHAISYNPYGHRPARKQVCENCGEGIAPILCSFLGNKTAGGRCEGSATAGR